MWCLVGRAVLKSSEATRLECLDQDGVLLQELLQLLRVVEVLHRPSCLSARASYSSREGALWHNIATTVSYLLTHPFMQGCANLWKMYRSLSRCNPRPQYPPHKPNDVAILRRLGPVSAECATRQGYVTYRHNSRVRKQLLQAGTAWRGCMQGPTLPRAAQPGSPAGPT